MDKDVVPALLFLRVGCQAGALLPRLSPQVSTRANIHQFLRTQESATEEVNVWDVGIEVCCDGSRSASLRFKLLVNSLKERCSSEGRV